MLFLSEPDVDLRRQIRCDRGTLARVRGALLRTASGELGQRARATGTSVKLDASELGTRRYHEPQASRMKPDPRKTTPHGTFRSRGFTRACLPRSANAGGTRCAPRRHRLWRRGWTSCRDHDGRHVRHTRWGLNQCRLGRSRLKRRTFRRNCLRRRGFGRRTFRWRTFRRNCLRRRSFRWRSFRWSREWWRNSRWRTFRRNCLGRHTCRWS